MWGISESLQLHLTAHFMPRMQNLQREWRLLCIANLSSSYSWAYSADMRARWRCPGKFIMLCRLPKVITRYANAAEQRRRAGNPAALRCKANTDLGNIKERAASASRLVDPHPESCCCSYAADKSHCGAWTHNKNWLLSVSRGQIWKNQEWTSMKSRFSPAEATPMTSDDMLWHVVH